MMHSCYNKHHPYLNHDSTPRLRGPLYYKTLHKQSSEFLITQLDDFRHQNWRVNIKPFLIPDLMGKSQVNFVKSDISNKSRSKSSDEEVSGNYCNKFRRLIQQGFFNVKQTKHKKIIYRLRILVRAVQLVLTFFKFKKARINTQKNSRRLSKQRISIAKPRKQSGQSVMIQLPQLAQIEALQLFRQNESSSELMSPQSQPYLLKKKQKTYSQINFDNFLKRPIQQFIRNKIFSTSTEHKLQTCPTKRSCKTEHYPKRFASMSQLHRKLQLSKAYSIQN